MDNCWNRDYRAEVLRFFEPVTGPIATEYLSNDDGSVMLEELDGNPSYVSFINRGRIARYDFALYVRTNGRDTASRKRAVDLLMAAANKCVKERPFPDSYIELTDFPKMFNRNMSGNEEYRAGFSMFFKMSAGEIPLEEVT